MREVIAHHNGQPFTWGASDCTMFADVVRVMTGFDPIAEYRTYTTEIGAVRMLKKAGVTSMIEFVALHFPEIPPARAGRGDLAFAADAMGPLMCPAILDGSFAHSKNMNGAVMWSRADICRTFAV
jgi:hypothetical protein